MLEGFSTAELFLCWVAWARKMQRLESGIIWRFIHSCVCWLMLATDRDICWGLPRYPHMASSSGWLGFLIAWGLGSKSKHPKFYHLLWLYLRSHIALLSDLDHRDSALDRWSIKVILSEKRVERGILLQPFWKLSFATYTIYLSLRP